MGCAKKKEREIEREVEREDMESERERGIERDRNSGPPREVPENYTTMSSSLPEEYLCRTSSLTYLLNKF